MKMSKKITLKAIALAAVMAVLMACFGWADVFAADPVMDPLLLDVSPKGSVSLMGGETLTLEALAASGSTVTAQVDGKTVSLSATSRTEDGGVWYEGSYTVPTVQKDTSLGQLKFTASKDGRAETRVGAQVTAVVLQKYVDVENPGGGSSGSVSGSLDNVTPASGDIVRINAEYADIFSSVDRGEEYASPYWYNLPQNTMDYAIGTTSSSYILKSGRRVSKSNATVVKNGTNGNNEISGVTVKNDGTFTILTFKQDWAVPFNLTPSPLTYASSTSNTVTSCNPTSVTLTFDYTTAYSVDNLSFPSGSAFTSASWKVAMNNGIPQVQVTLNLSQKGAYYGAYATYGTDGTLTLKFLNPVTSLKGARIVIDAGHGSGDAGNTGGGVKEADVNLAHAQALKTELESRGATVYLLETRAGSYVSVTQRAQMATKWMPHVYIAVHQNSVSGNNSARGVETYYNTPWSQRLAKYINDELYQAYLTLPYAGNAKDRGNKFSEFAVTRTKQFASVLVEYGFLTNSEEKALLTNSSYYPVFAEAVADGIDQFLSGK